MTDLDVLRYRTFEAIPDAAHMQRFQELASRAHRQLSLDGPDSCLSTEEWHCLTVMAPDKADDAHRQQRKKRDQQERQKQQAPKQKCQPYDLSGDTFDEFCDRNAARSVPFAVFKGMVTAQREKREALEKRVEALEARNTELLKTIESKPTGLRYRGTYDPNREYVPDDGITDHGALWVCLRTTRSRPGETDNSQSRSCWQLALPRGRQGAQGPAGLRGDR